MRDHARAILGTLAARQRALWRFDVGARPRRRTSFSSRRAAMSLPGAGDDEAGDEDGGPGKEHDPVVQAGRPRDGVVGEPTLDPRWGARGR